MNRCVFMKPWTWRSIVRPKRLNVASTCTEAGDTNWAPPPPAGAFTLPVTLMPTLGAAGPPAAPGPAVPPAPPTIGCSDVLRMKSAMLPPPPGPPLPPVPPPLPPPPPSLPPL